MFIFNKGQQQNFVLDSFEKLNLLIDEWKNGILEHRKDIYVAISRKAPRLLEWSLGEQFSVDIPVITEFALPFVDMTNYSRCAVLDEAIYHGTTFEKVLTLVETANSKWEQLEANPLVITEEALNSDLINNHLLFHNHVIEQNELPFFIDSIISKFLELGKPYDVEYPIIYVDLEHDITEVMLDDIMARMAAVESDVCFVSKDKIHYYKVENYSHEQDKMFFSYTYRTDYRFANEAYGIMMPDFSKLRFYAKGSRLCIASIAPYTIPELFVARNHPMFIGEFEEIWKMLYDRVRTIDNKEYVYQRMKSLVMTTNYLLSYGHFLNLKNSLSEALGHYAQKVEFYQEKSDLVYLFGNELASNLLDRLSEVQSFTINGAAHNLGKSDDALIPFEFSANYNQQIAWDNLQNNQTKNVSLMISSMFSAMHWQIEIPSRKAKYEDYSRLRFGESYVSISERLERTIKDANLLENIHENIDQRIDHGTIVPNYVKLENGIFSNWKRLFRSGENEDAAKDQLLRIVLAIVMNYLKMVGRDYVMRDVLEFILSIVYFVENDSEKNILPERLFGLTMRPSFNIENYMYEMEVLIGGKNVPILQYAEDNGILSEDRFRFVSISNSPYVEELVNGCPLNGEMLVALNKILSFVSSVDTDIRSYSEVILDLLNNFYYSDANISFDALKGRVKRELECFILADVFAEDNVKKLDLLCLEVFFRKVKTSDEILPKKVHDILDGDLYHYLLAKSHQMNDNETYIYMLSALNLWYYFHLQKVDQFFDQELYNIFLDLIDGKNLSFSDGIVCFNWLYFDGSYENVQNVSEEELRWRLCELLNFKL